MNKRGETLLEVLIALTLVTVSSAAAASAIISANQGLSLSKNYLIAQNLASEALEAVKNIRDTNWMKFPVNKETCWLNIQPDNDPDNPMPASACGPADETKSFKKNSMLTQFYYYKIAFDVANGKWVATNSDATIDSPTPDQDEYGLSLKSTNRYGPLAAGETVSYYRGLKVIDQDTTLGGQSITIQVIVKWYQGAKMYSITGTEILTNYL